MEVFGWALAGVAALMLGLGFAVLSGNLLLAAAPAVSVLLIAAYLSWEARPMKGATRATGRRRRNAPAGERGRSGGRSDGR